MSSFGFKQYGNGWRIDGQRLYLFGVGRVAVRWHRPLEGKPKTCRIVKKADGWYVAIVCETTSEPLPENTEEIGIDLGISALATLSNGQKINNPQFYRHSQKTLRRKQRALSRKAKGGANRNKQRQVVARQHLKVKRQREDYLNKVVHDLIQNYGFIVLEDLVISNMVRNRHLSKSILDSGWGFMKRRLLDKAEEAGRVVLFVNPHYTSQTCNSCNQRFPQKVELKDRWVGCSCGMSLDRDHNAAINILAVGRTARAQTQSVATSVARKAFY